MVIDVHGHFTTTPPQVAGFRKRQVEYFERTALPRNQPRVTRSRIFDNT
jgi:hypothetical protein